MSIEVQCIPRGLGQFKQPSQLLNSLSVSPLCYSVSLSHVHLLDQKYKIMDFSCSDCETVLFILEWNRSYCYCSSHVSSQRFLSESIHLKNFLKQCAGSPPPLCPSVFVMKCTDVHMSVLTRARCKVTKCCKASPALLCAQTLMASWSITSCVCVYV